MTHTHNDTHCSRTICRDTGVIFALAMTPGISLKKICNSRIFILFLLILIFISYFIYSDFNWFHFRILICVEGKWLWLDGSDLTWTAWREDRPNDHNDQDCLMLQKKAQNEVFETFVWNDKRCGLTYNFICEKNLTQSGNLHSAT